MSKKGYMIEFLIALAIFACVIALIGTLIVHATETNQTDDGEYEYIILEDGTVEITKYMGNGTEITIPGIIDGKNVTSIGNDAFYEYENLTNIIIQEGIKDIGYSAFEGCTNLTNIIIPESVTIIKSNTFRYCTSLTSITLPDSITDIGSYVFESCINLTSITIPENVTSIENDVFSFCESLKEIEVDPENQAYTSENGVLFNKEKTQLICYPSGKQDLEYVIPEGVTSIGWSAFWSCKNLKGITLPDSIVNIGSFAFALCDNLENILMSEGVTSIGKSAFSGCAKLANITIPEGISSIEEGTFVDCTSLTSIIIPEGVTSIGDSAFEGCVALTSVTLPESITEIGSWCFSDCLELTNITIPQSVISIGAYAFHGCGDLTEIIIPEGVTSIEEETFAWCSSLTEMIIPEGVISIGDNAFEWCDDLTNITIPENVTSIGNGVFSYCEDLKEIEVAPNNQAYSSENGVLFNKEKTELICYPEGKQELEYIIPESVVSIGDYAFEWCDDLTNITIPESVVSIGDCAFRWCDGLTNITISENVTSIGNGAFSDCEGLKEIEVDSNNQVYSSENGVLFNKQKTELIRYPEGKQELEYIIPESVTNIENEVFSHCEYLTNITIPESVVSIGDYAFSGCRNLEDITIPKNVTSIGDYAFETCYNLKNITIPENVTNIGDSIFEFSELTLTECNDNTSIIEIPEILKRAYDTEDILYAYDNITLTNCSINNGLTQININDINKNAYIEINSGKLEYLTIKINSHNWDFETSTCLICGKVCAHEYDDGTVIEDATCTEDGVKLYTCEICEGIKTETIEKLDHSFENGECTVCGTKEEIEDIEISTEDYTIKNSNITDIKPATIIKDFAEKIDTNGEIKIYKGETEITAEDAKIGTGMRVVITKDNEVKEFIAVVTGDLNGDGKMSDGDLLRLVRYRAGLDKTLAGVYLEAADIVKDNVPAKDSDILKFARVHAGLDNL